MAIDNNWVSRVSAADNEWRSITYGNGLFVAVAKSGTGNRVMTSPDGITWTSRTSAGDFDWHSVTFGNNIFVAVAFSSSSAGNSVMTSPDGITWTLRSQPNNLAWNSVTYGNGLFVAVCDNPSNSLGVGAMTSPDGITWTNRTSPTKNWTGVTYGNGLFVAISRQASSALEGNDRMTSTDGITWTLREWNTGTNWYSVTYGNGLFVAVGSTNDDWFGGFSPPAYRSSNGIDWVESGSGLTGSTYYSVFYADGYFVTVGDAGVSGVSEDGINWISKVSSSSNDWEGVTFGNNRFVAVSSNGTGNRVQTLDLPAPASWALINLGDIPGFLYLDYSGHGCVILANQSVLYAIRLYKNGVLWVDQTLGFDNKVFLVESGTYYYEVDVIIDGTICETATSETITVLPYNPEFDFSIGLTYGAGTITINGLPPKSSYEAGSSLIISVTLASGFTGINWFENPNFVTPIASTASFTYIMPARDTTITGQMVGTYTPTDTYGLKYFAEYGSIEGNCKRLEILKDGYNPSSGTSEIKLGEVTFGWGNTGDDPLKTIIGSYLDFEVFGGVDDFTEFIEGDALTWQVKYYENRTDTIPFFVGYISPDFITIQENQTIQRQQFTAIDGLKGFDAIRANSFWQFGTADQGVYGALNQIYPVHRKVNIASQLWETRMTPNQAPFFQFETPFATIFKDGKEVEFKDGTRVINERLFLKDVIERLVNPFLCRVFLWRNEFWIVRIPEIAKSQLNVNRIYPREDYTIADNTVDVSCIINNPERTARRVFTEFTASLNFGTLDASSQGSVLNTINSQEDWVLYPQILNSYKLKGASYTRCKPTGQPSSRPRSDIAIVQYNTDRESMRIWATTTNAGLSDPNISYVSLQPSYQLAQETANTISLSFEYMAWAISTDPRRIGSYRAGIMLKIGDRYLRKINETQFDFVDFENVVLIDIPSVFAWHSYTISNLIVPTDGFVEFRMYQLICLSGANHEYSIEFRKLNLAVEENKSLTLAKQSVKAITNDKFSNVHEEYNTYIGDAETNNSTSAIVLTQANRPHSVAWTRDGVESLPLMDLIVQDLANLKGRTNQRILGTVERQEIRPYQRIKYRDNYYMVISIKLDTYRNRWECELFQLD